MKKLLKISAVAVIALATQSYAMGESHPQATKIGQVELSQDKNQVDENRTNQWYGGLGFSDVKVSCKNGCEDITFGIIGKVGYDFNDYIGVEGRVIKTFMEYEQSKVEHYGLFAKPMYPITEKLDIYGLLGYAKTDVGNIKSYNGSGLSWGVGVDYFFDDNEKEKLNKIKELKQRYADKKNHTKKETDNFEKKLNDLKENKNDFGLFLEYQSLIEKSNAPDIDGFNLGLLYRF